MSFLWLSMLLTLTALHQNVVQSLLFTWSKDSVPEGKNIGRLHRNHYEPQGDQQYVSISGMRDGLRDTSERKTRFPRQTAAKDLERAARKRQREEYLRESRENFRDVVVRVLHAFLSASNQRLKQSREEELGRRSAAAIAAAQAAAVQASPYLRESLRAATGNADSSLVSLPGPHAVVKCDCGRELAVHPVTVVDRSAVSQVHVHGDSGTLREAKTSSTEKSTSTLLVKPTTTVLSGAKESGSSLLGGAKKAGKDAPQSLLILPSLMSQPPSSTGVEVSEGGDVLREVKRPTTVYTGKDISVIGGAGTTLSDLGGKTLRARQREEMLRNVGHASGEVAAGVLERMSSRVGTAVTHLLLGH